MSMRYQDLHVNGEDYAYKTSDTVEEVETPGYFDQVWEHLYRLDYIRVTADINSDRPCMCWFRVDQIDGKEVYVTKIGDWHKGSGAVPDREPKDPDKRINIVVRGIRQYVKKHPDLQDRDFYTNQGLPDARLLQPFTGFPVTSNDRDAGWSVIQSDLKDIRQSEA